MNYFKVGHKYRVKNKPLNLYNNKVYLLRSIDEKDYTFINIMTGEELKTSTQKYSTLDLNDPLCVWECVTDNNSSDNILETKYHTNRLKYL